MNLTELQAFLEDSNWDDDPLPAHPSDSEHPSTLTPDHQEAVDTDPVPTLGDVVVDNIPTLTPDAELNRTARTPPVKLVPRPKEEPMPVEPELSAGGSIKDRLMEVEMAQKMGYLLCKCTWPPQIMVLTGTDHIYRCRRCSRVREM